MNRYEFRLTLSGEGDDENDAWLDAIESFSSSPGLPPDDYELCTENEGLLDWLEEIEI